MIAPQATRRRVYRTAPRTAGRVPCDLWSRPAFVRADVATPHLYLLVRTGDAMSQCGVSDVTTQRWAHLARCGVIDVHRMLNDLWTSALLDLDHGHSELFMPDLLLAEVSPRDGDVLECAIQDAITVRTPRFRSAIAADL